MQTKRLAIPDVVVLTPRRFEDERGVFYEAWSQRDLAQLGFHCRFVQENVSTSLKAGTVRGLHYQSPPHSQAKLVRCSRGRIFDVVVDVRRGSPWFGRWVGAELSAQSADQIFVPEGFLHGYATLEDGAEVVYQCTGHYAPAAEGAVRYDDPDLAIGWPLGALRPILSPKDSAAPGFKEMASPFVYENRPEQSPAGA